MISSFFMSVISLMAIVVIPIVSVAALLCYSLPDRICKMKLCGDR